MKTERELPVRFYYVKTRAKTNRQLADLFYWQVGQEP